MHYLSQFLLCAVLTVTVGLYAIKWAQAYRTYKVTGDALHLILLTVATVLSGSAVYGLSLIFS